LEDDILKYFGDSNTLQTPAHRKMVIKFVRDQYPQARFQRIYDANTDGWEAKDFHINSDNKGWTLTIVETTKGFIFGGFTTAEWESPVSKISKPCAHSFLFSVNEGSKYPIAGGDRTAIESNSDYCAIFGTVGIELRIWSNSNTNNKSWCYAKKDSFKLPVA
jgi:hypothetical protein